MRKREGEEIEVEYEASKTFRRSELAATRIIYLKLNYFNRPSVTIGIKFVWSHINIIFFFRRHQ